MRFIHFWIVLLLPFCIPMYGVAQHSVSLVPQFNQYALQAHVLMNSADQSVEAANSNFRSSGGLQLRYTTQDQWTFFAGWTILAPALSYRHDGISKAEWWVNNQYSHRLPLGVEKAIVTVQWIRLSPTSFLAKLIYGSPRDPYLIAFRSKIIAGGSSDRYRSIPGNLLQENGRSYSIFGGLGVHFFAGAKDRLQINIIYSYGLRNLTEATIEYQRNGTNYNGVLGSRGSFLAFEFGYPITLYRR